MGAWLEREERISNGTTGYVITHGGSNYSPEGRVDAGLDVAKHNDAIEREELAHWATQPGAFPAYVTSAEVGASVTTWQGKAVGTITRLSRYRTNLSRSMVAISVQGTNGANYYGRFGDEWKCLCIIRKSKVGKG